MNVLRSGDFWELSMHVLAIGLHYSHPFWQKAHICPAKWGRRAARGVWICNRKLDWKKEALEALTGFVFHPYSIGLHQVPTVPCWAVNLTTDHASGSIGMGTTPRDQRPSPPLCNWPETPSNWSFCPFQLEMPWCIMFTSLVLCLKFHLPFVKEDID